jgi:hypothetical protein
MILGEYHLAAGINPMTALTYHVDMFSTSPHASP